MNMELQEQKEIWRKEQLEVASQVIVLPDDTQGDQCVYQSERFCGVQFLPENSDDCNDASPIYLGGVDVSFPNPNIDKEQEQAEEHNNNSSQGNTDQPSVAVYVILEYPSGKIVYQDHEYFDLTVPYIPSYLAFREIDPLQRLIRKQVQTQPKFTPKAILVDGNGIFHPRQAGIACFVGVQTGIPTIGVGKTLFYEGDLSKELVLQQLTMALHNAAQEFCGTHDNPLKELNDSDVVLIDRQSIPKLASDETDDNDSNKTNLDRGELIQKLATVCRGVAVPLTNEDGTVLAAAMVGHGGQVGKKARPGTKNPIYISVGHNISLQQAIGICASVSWAKIPEPVRQADLIGRGLLRKKGQM